MTWSKVMIVAVCAAMAVASSTLIRASLLQVRNGPPLDLLHQCGQFMKMPLFWSGVCLFLFSNLLWIYILGTLPLATSYPLHVSLLFVFNTSVSAVVFRERLSGVGIAGIGLVLLGVLMVTSTKALQ